MVHESRPIFTTSYLGVVPQELAYAASSPSNLGPRLYSFVGAIVAASLLLGWLYSRGTPRWAALTISLAFLLDPIFNLSYRQGRTDSWAFAIIFAACLLLRNAWKRRENQQDIRWPIFFAGFLTGASPFVWPTTLALFPLVCLELFYLVQSDLKKGRGTLFSCMKPIVLWFGIGGLISVAILLIPIVLQWDSHSISFISGIKVQKTASMIQRSIIDMFSIYDPVIIPVVVASLLIRRELGLILAGATALIMMYQTMIYPMRILYLLPYLIAAVAAAYAKLSQNDLIRWRHAVLFCALGMLLAWNVGVTLVYRPLVALTQKQARSPAQIQQALVKSIGQGPYRVLILEWDMYYAARTLGWKIYKIGGQYIRQQDDFKEFLASMDFVILRDKFILFKDVNLEELENSGFELSTTVSFKQPQQTSIDIGPFTFTTSDTVYDDVMIFKKSR